MLTTHEPHNTGSPEVVDPRDGDEDFGDTLRYAIRSYGADMPVESLVRRMGQEDIFVPSFQRKFVWSQKQASRFIESLLLDLPVPGIFLFREPDTKRLMVVDGQQRLVTLERYHHGLFGNKRFGLVGVSREFAGVTYDSLLAPDRRQLDDSIIHATIFEQLQPSDDRSSVYAVFERLNTGGTKLMPQEIRACVYRGQLNDLLEQLAQDASWRQLYRSNSNRRKDEEIILRFLALSHSLDVYERPMKQFLNDFMEEHMNPGEDVCRSLGDRFREVVGVIAGCLGAEALRPQRSLNVSVADAVMVGLARRLQAGPIRDIEVLQEAHQEVLRQLEREQLYKFDTTDKERVHRRIQIASEAYRGVT